MRKLIVGNWKLNPDEISEARELGKATDIKGVVICPPLVFLEEVGGILQNAKLGAQDTFWEEEGAYTGEVSPAQLKDLGVEYVLVGHSERRQYLGETDAMVARKVQAALEVGITPILCVGEDSSTHEKGGRATKNFIQRQLKLGLGDVDVSKVVIAYEPIWAIGTGNSEVPSEANATIRYIKEKVGDGVSVLYGGSVNTSNAESFINQPDIDGLLVGGASTDAAELKGIAKLNI